MGIFENCILASDIDNTLVADGYINPKNIEKIDYFIKEGGVFSLATGRGAGAISMALNALENVSICIVANGCLIYDYQNKKSLYEAQISKEDYRIADFVCNCGLNVGCEIHCGADAYTLRRTAEVDDHQQYENFTAEDKTFEDLLEYNWNKVIFTFDSFEDREKLEKMLEDESCSCDFIETTVELGGRARPYYEIVPKGISKATAIIKLADILNIKKGKIFAIGDYYNDLEMLKAADISAVPLTSPEDIKEIADYITVPCKDGAVADFIDYLTNNFLIRKDEENGSSY